MSRGQKTRGVARLVPAVEDGTRPGRALVVAGQPIREPIVRHGPFAMTTREEIIEAIRDFRASRF